MTTRRRYSRRQPRRRFYPRPWQGSGSPYGRLIDPTSINISVPGTGALAVGFAVIETAGSSATSESVHLYKASIQYHVSLESTTAPSDQELGNSIIAYPLSCVQRDVATAPVGSAAEVVNDPNCIIGHPFLVSIRNGGMGSIVLRRNIHLMNNIPGGAIATWLGGLLITGLNKGVTGTTTASVGMVPRYYQRFQYPGRSSG